MENKNNQYIWDATRIKIFSDGPTLDEISAFDRAIITGFTFNPSLFREHNVTDYLGFCQDVLDICGAAPISLEVIADERDEMIKQARKLSELAENVYVKIPISYTSGETTLPVIEALVTEGVNLNITAVFTLQQVENILAPLASSRSIISVFAGRLFDIGIDAVQATRVISDYTHENSQCQVLWASPRMVFDIKNAVEADCDIITMKPSLIKKIGLLGKTPEEYSLDTVKMFYGDAIASGYHL